MHLESSCDRPVPRSFEARSARRRSLRPSLPGTLVEPGPRQPVRRWLRWLFPVSEVPRCCQGLFADLPAAGLNDSTLPAVFGRTKQLHPGRRGQPCRTLESKATGDSRPRSLQFQNSLHQQGLPVCIVRHSSRGRFWLEARIRSPRRAGAFYMVAGLERTLSLLLLPK